MEHVAKLQKTRDYDNFKDGNYTENPKWFVTDLNAVILRNNGTYVAELTKSSDNDGTFKTTNYLTSNTEWGCSICFENSEGINGSIDFVLSAASIYTLTAKGYFIRINTLSKITILLIQQLKNQNKCQNKQRHKSNN